MAEGSNTPIVVAAIGALATITVGILANIDKLRAMFGTAGSGSAQAAQSGPQVAAGSKAASAAPAPANVAGTWVDTDGYVFRITQNGANFSYDQFLGGQRNGQGGGTVSGRRLRYNFSSDASGTGSCEAELEPSGTAISGRCQSGNDVWQFRVTRQGGAN